MTVQTGWRPPLTARERGWLDGFVPMGRTTNWTPVNPRAGFGRGLSAETLLEFMRDPPADLGRFRGAFGLAAGGEALITCEDALYVIPLVQVTGFKVERTLPAKGGGGSRAVRRLAQPDTPPARPRTCPSRAAPAPTT